MSRQRGRLSAPRPVRASGAAARPTALPTRARWLCGVTSRRVGRGWSALRARGGCRDLRDGPGSTGALAPTCDAGRFAPGFGGAWRGLPDSDSKPRWGHDRLAVRGRRAERGRRRAASGRASGVGRLRYEAHDDPMVTKPRRVRVVAAILALLDRSVWGSPRLTMSSIALGRCTAAAAGEPLDSPPTVRNALVCGRGWAKAAAGRPS